MWYVHTSAHISYTKQLCGLILSFWLIAHDGQLSIMSAYPLHDTGPENYILVVNSTSMQIRYIREADIHFHRSAPGHLGRRSRGSGRGGNHPQTVRPLSWWTFCSRPWFYEPYPAALPPWPEPSPDTQSPRPGNAGPNRKKKRRTN